MMKRHLNLLKMMCLDLCRDYGEQDHLIKICAWFVRKMANNL